jgi:hypothetical protein
VISPEERLAQLQTQRLLADLVESLAEPYRQAVRLRYFEGRSASEIAADTGVPASTVRGRLRTALAELREQVQRRCGGGRIWVIALEKLTHRPTLAGGPSGGGGSVVGEGGPSGGGGTHGGDGTGSAAALAGSAAPARWVLTALVIRGAGDGVGGPGAGGRGVGRGLGGRCGSRGDRTRGRGTSDGRPGTAGISGAVGR